MIQFLRKIFFVYFRPYWKQCLLLFLCLALAIVFETVLPLGIKYLIDEAIEPQDWHLLVVWLSALAGLYLVSSLGNMAADYLAAMISTRALNDLRLKMFTHLQDLPASFYTRLQSGDVTNRFNNDLIAIQYALTLSVIPGVQAALQLILNVVVLFLLNVPMAVVTLVLLPLAAILPKRFADRATVLSNHHKAEEARISTMVQEQVQMQAVNRAFGLKNTAVASFTGQLAHFATSAIRSSFYEGLVLRTTNMGQYLIQLLVIAIGMVLAFRGILSVGALVGFIELLVTLGETVSEVSKAYSELITARTSLERIESFLREEARPKDRPDVSLQPLVEEIRFDQVSFSYAGAGGKPDLGQVDLTLQAGRPVVFVGRSGAGKSTLLNLLMGFYDPDQGHITIDHQDIRQVSLESLRSQMAVVFQDTCLFNTSLRENIRIGKTGASDSEVEQAARAAGIHDFILSLPQGYDTLVQEHGRGLSAGQSQRIALARALIRNPALLLLDEATSGLDPETENLIYDTLRQLGCTCTILVVTHRLAPVAELGWIVVMDQGRVMEQGTHSELMKQNGLYARLYNQQSGFKVSSDGRYAEVTPARLRGFPLFEKLDDRSLENLATQFVSERFGAGETVIRAGDLGDKFYIVVRGKVEVLVNGSDGQPVRLAVREDGDYFGEIALLESVPRTATLRTLQPSLFLSLDRKHFENMLASFPEVRAVVEQAAKERMKTLV